MVCVIARCLLSRIILHKLIVKRKNSAHGQRPYILFVPRNIRYSYPDLFISLSWPIFVTEVIYNAVLTEFCVFSAVEIYP